MNKLNKLISDDQVLSEFYEHLIVLSEVDSTNNFAKNLNEKKHGICIYSANQKFGYGRNNRKWITLQIQGKNHMYIGEKAVTLYTV